ncbi:MAG: hypothetical protein Kow00114_04670 [Kiloniellaceae bacterium]
MSEGTRPQELSSQEQLLLYHLLSCTVPFKEGGGVVFPDGFPGVGYRLEDWQFERYRARLHLSVLGNAGQGHQGVALLLLIIIALAIFAATFGARMLEPLELGLDNWDMIRLLVISVAVAWTMQRVMRMQVPEEARSKPFEECPKVRRLAYLPRRALGMIASGRISMKGQHLRMLVGGSLGLLLLALGITESEFRRENLFLAAMFLAWSIRPAFFCWVNWRFRLARGRAPTREDLEPV